MYVSLVSGIALYGLIMPTLGSDGAYPRLHLSFDPLMLVVLVGTLMMRASPRRGARPDTDEAQKTRAQVTAQPAPASAC